MAKGVWSPYDPDTILMALYDKIHLWIKFPFAKALDKTKRFICTCLGIK